jgi:acetyl-CoA acetyltransferase
MRPLFRRKVGRTTALSATGLTDGGAVALIASKSTVEKYNLPVLARIVGYTSVGTRPDLFGDGPALAVQKLLAMLSLNLNDIDIIELHEAFASTAVVAVR